MWREKGEERGKRMRGARGRGRERIGEDERRKEMKGEGKMSNEVKEVKSRKAMQRQ